MNDQIIDALSNASTEELLRIAANKNNEFNEETVNFARQTLEERNFDLTQIEGPKGDTPRSGDEEIRSMRFKSIVHIIVGPVLVLGGAVVLTFSLTIGRFPLAMVAIILFGIRNIYMYFKLRDKMRTLDRTRDYVLGSSLTQEELSLVQGLRFAIIDANYGDSSKLETFLAGHINKENFGQVTSLYRAEYYTDFVDEIKDISSEYAKIEKALQPLIAMGLVERKYPHSRII